MVHISKILKKVANKTQFFKTWIQKRTAYPLHINPNLTNLRDNGQPPKVEKVSLKQRAHRIVKNVFWATTSKITTPQRRSLVKSLLLFFVTVVLYFKHIYSIIFVLILGFEYISIISYLLDIYRNYSDFYELRIEKINIDDKNSLELWFFYCRALAFLRIYNALEKHKISPRNLLIFFVIVIFAIPLKFLRLSYYLLKSKKSVRENLEYLCADIYYKSKDLRIEIYKGEIYLNCYTLGHLVRNISTVYGVKNKELLAASLMELSTSSKELKLDNTKLMPLKRSLLVTEKGKTVPIPHYTHVFNGSAIHATSNLPDKLEEGQRKDIPMMGAIKEGSKSPGTIISPHPSRVLELHGKLFIPQHSIETIQNRHGDVFPFHGETEKINAERTWIFRSAFIRMGLESTDDRKVIDPLVIGVYNRSLENCNENSIWVEVNATLKDETS